MWVLDAEDPLVLRGEGVASIELPYRKVGDVLRALVERPGALFDRVQLSSSMWPDLPRASALANLRQCLCHIRELLGRSAVLSDRTRCGLSRNCPVRLANPTASTTAAVGKSPLASFSEFAVWYASDSPRQLLDLLRAAPDLALAFSGSELAHVVGSVAKLPPSEEIVGWVDYWAGIRDVNTAPRPAHNHLRRALDHANRTGDDVLLENASYWLGVVKILLGRVLEAKPILLHAQHRLAKGKSFNRKLAKLESLILLHDGRTAEAFERLHQVSLHDGVSEAEYAADEAMRALFFAFSGDYGRARRILDSVQGLRSSSSNASVSAFNLLTIALLVAVENPSAGAEALAKATAVCRQIGDAHLEVYCQESLAVHLGRHGQKLEGRRVMRGAEALRGSLGLGVTRWDRGRVATILALA